MPFNAETYRVLIASPSDLGDERQAATEAVNDWNALHADAESAVLLPVKWETHAMPQSGIRPQEAINRQFVRECDILVGMFWTKIGTDTGVAESGTVEEIDQFVAVGKPALLYFSSRPIDPNKIDLEQLKKLKDFKSATYKNALVGSFSSVDELRQMLFSHLVRQVRDLKSNSPSSRRGGTLDQEEMKKVASAATVVANAPTHSGSDADWTVLGPQILSTIKVEDNNTAQALVRTVVLEQRDYTRTFAAVVIGCLQSKDENLRWKASRVIEELVLWAPNLVDAAVLASMAKDRFFSVRSSAAVCYFHLAVLNPVVVPIDVLHDLAAHGEDWYVSTPATRALLRLARSRPIVIDLLVLDLQSQDEQAREHAASAVRLLARHDWDLVSGKLLTLMSQSADPYLKKVGQECSIIKQEHSSDLPKDYSAF